MSSVIGICRLCATVRKIDVLITIKDENNEICVKARLCCDLDIRLKDFLPKSVCRECLQELDKVHDFYLKVKEAQESLKLLCPTKSPLKTGKDEDDITFSLLTVVDDNQSPEQQHDILYSTIDKYEDSPFDKKQKQQKVPVLQEERLPDITNQLNSKHLLEKVYELLDLDKDTDDVLDFSTENKSPNIIQKVCSETDKVNSGHTKDIIKPMKSPLEECNVEDETDMNNTIVVFEESESFEDEEYLSDISIENSGNTQKFESLKRWDAYSWQCILCSYTSNCFSSLDSHARAEHGSKEFDLLLKCIDCQKTLLRYNSFLNHVRFHHHEKLKLCCDACDELCEDLQQLSMHRKEHCLNSSKYPKIEICIECGKVFQNSISLRIHNRMQHIEAEKNFGCLKCDKSFKSVGALHQHQRVHSDTKTFSCEMCGRSFRHKVNLQVHVYSHVPEKPHVCRVCNKSFKTYMSLEKHIKIHTGERDHKCDYCGKSFLTRDAKLSHERTHTGEKPYKCQYCDSSYRFRGTLLSHMNCHTGRRPYSCDACDHHFTNWSNYNKHMKRRHSAEALNKKANKRNARKTKAKVLSEEISTALSFDMQETNVTILSATETDTEEGLPHKEQEEYLFDEVD